MKKPLSFCKTLCNLCASVACGSTQPTSHDLKFERLTHGCHVHNDIDSAWEYSPGLGAGGLQSWYLWWSFGVCIHDEPQLNHHEDSTSLWSPVFRAHSLGLRPNCHTMTLSRLPELLPTNLSEKQKKLYVTGLRLVDVHKTGHPLWSDVRMSMSVGDFRMELYIYPVNSLSYLGIQ